MLIMMEELSPLHMCMDVIATISPADNFGNVAVAHSIEGVKPTAKEDLLGPCTTAVGEMEGTIGAAEGTMGPVLLRKP